MKYIKLFEQDWWEEESPFDNLEPKLLIGRYSNVIYLLADNGNDTVELYGNTDSPSYRKNMFYYNIVLNDLSRIITHDGEMFYKDLPKEIKDRLV